MNPHCGHVSSAAAAGAWRASASWNTAGSTAPPLPAQASQRCTLVTLPPTTWDRWTVATSEQSEHWSGWDISLAGKGGMAGWQGEAGAGAGFDFAVGGGLMEGRPMSSLPRIVITGLGLTAPNGNSLAEFRANLLAGKARIAEIDVRHMGRQPAGVCDFDATKWQKRKEIRNGTRVGSISIYCAREALGDAGLDWDRVDKSRVGVYLGITEHGNVETENEIHNIEIGRAHV